jgi:hypothetical protein
VGDQSAAVLTAELVAYTSEVVPPPTSSTLPSGSIVKLCCVRASAMLATARQVGDGRFMSMT